MSEATDEQIITAARASAERTAKQATEKALVAAAARAGIRSGRSVALGIGVRGVAAGSLRRSWPGALAGVLVDSSIDGVRLVRGDIDGATFRRRVVRSGAEATGSVGGAALGAAIGSVVPGIGTVVGGVVGGLLGGRGVRRLFPS